jgi:hypothetical protein
MINERPPWCGALIDSVLYAAVGNDLTGSADLREAERPDQQHAQGQEAQGQDAQEMRAEALRAEALRAETLRQIRLALILDARLSGDDAAACGFDPYNSRAAPAERLWLKRRRD